MRRKIWNLVCVLGFTALACGGYLFIGNDINKSFAIVDKGSGVKASVNTTSGCGSYLGYPPRCSEGYETKSVKYGTRTCYTACVKKDINIGSDFCKTGSAFGTIFEAREYCQEKGYSYALQHGTTTSGKICASCSVKKATCQNSYGEYDTQKMAIDECGGVDSVKSTKRNLNSQWETCYSCKSVSKNSQKCAPDNIGYCLNADACEGSGGIWALGTCKAKYGSYNEFCASKGLSYTKKACSENYESIPIAGVDSGAGYMWSCYSNCLPTAEYQEVLNCQNEGLSITKPKCGIGEESLKIEGVGGHTTCYTECKKAGEIGTEDVKIELMNNNLFEQDAILLLAAQKEGLKVYVSLDAYPTDDASKWVTLPYSDKIALSKNINLDESGSYYVYTKDSSGNVTLANIVDVVNPANNVIKDLGVGFSVDGFLQSYYGDSMNTQPFGETLDDYIVLGPQSVKRSSGSFQMLSSNKKVYDVKLLGDSTSDKTLTVDPDTGLLLYTLSDSEKASLGITTEKVYVVASKPEAKLSRNDDGTFAKNENGDVIAAGKNELGTIYKITPKNDISTMSEYIFYAINLSYIENADYSDPNTWNDLKLLSYDTTTTADTDFTFEIVRNGYNDIVKQLSASKEDYRIMPLSSSTSENLGTFYIDFESDVTQYEFSVDDDQITLNPVLVYTDSTYVEGFGPRTVDLEYGLNVEYIKVESAKGSIRTYTLLITRIDSRSSDNTLRSLVARNVELTPTFAKYTNEYYGTVANNVTKIEVAAEKSSNNATFVEGYGSRTVNLKVGENIILVKVKSETESERTYKVVITREGTPEVVAIDKTKSANNSLKSLVLSSGNLMFDKEVLNYNLYVSNDITSILVTPTPEDEKATAILNGGTTLQIGSNKIEVVVTAENGETKTYTINVIRKEEGLVVSTDSTLSTLQIRGERISFSPINYLYNVVVFPGTDELVFNLEASNEKAQIEVIGNQELSDFTTVKIKVTAEDGSYSIYDVNVKVDNITVGEIVAFAVCTVLVVGLIVYGTVSRNKTQKELKLKEKEDLVK